eukprot:366311-Chlamydomonas_euryale.AAC.24
MLASLPDAPPPAAAMPRMRSDASCASSPAAACTMKKPRRAEWYAQNAADRPSLAAPLPSTSRATAIGSLRSCGGGAEGDCWGWGGSRPYRVGRFCSAGM